MDALERIKKDRDHLVKEVEDQRRKIEINKQKNNELSHHIDRHERLIKQYDEIISQVEDGQNVEKGVF